MSKIDCGALVAVGKNGIEFQGRVHLGNRLDGILTLKKHPRAGSSEEHPDFLIEYSQTGAAPRPAGAAWIKNGRQGADFITMTLDDPDWTSPIYLTAFAPIGDDKDWVIVWTRPRGARAQGESDLATK